MLFVPLSDIRRSLIPSTNSEYLSRAIRDTRVENPTTAIALMMEAESVSETSVLHAANNPGKSHLQDKTCYVYLG
jgi:hypothetical protein